MFSVVLCLVKCCEIDSHYADQLFYAPVKTVNSVNSGVVNPLNNYQQSLQQSLSQQYTQLVQKLNNPSLNQQESVAIQQDLNKVQSQLQQVQQAQQTQQVQAQQTLPLSLPLPSPQDALPVQAVVSVPKKETFESFDPSVNEVKNKNHTLMMCVRFNNFVN